mgnify:CR=1 FL=1
MVKAPMKTLIVCDKPAWSYWSIAQALVKHNTDPDLHIDVTALKGNVVNFLRRERDYCRVLLMGHQMWDLLPWYKEFTIDQHRWLTGIHSHHAFDAELKTSPDADARPPASLVRLLARFHGVNAVSQRLTDLFRREGLQVAYTPNGVDADIFKPMQPISTEGPLRVGVAYTPKGIHAKRKGVDGFIRPACEKVGAVLVEAKARSDQHVEPEDMPVFHNSVDCFAVGSSSEGFSIAMLEAAACGRPIISTRVGGATELIQNGRNGVLVDRTADAFAEVFDVLQRHRAYAIQMGEESRKVVEEQWSWEKRAPAWLTFLTA